MEDIAREFMVSHYVDEDGQAHERDVRRLRRSGVTHADPRQAFNFSTFEKTVIT